MEKVNWNVWTSNASRKNAPSITGINKRKENFTDSSFFTPAKNPVEIVIPALEIPGNNASACIKPINKEFFQFKFFSVFANLVKNTIIDVNKKNIPINRKEDKPFSIIPLKKKPNNNAGIVPIIKYNHIFLYLFSKVSKLKISFFKKIKTAIKEAIWNKVIKNKLGLSIKLEIKDKCPELEMGKNPAAACTIA